VLDELRKTRLLFAIGKANVTDTFAGALERSKTVIKEACS
jgi:hypothetical protein